MKIVYISSSEYPHPTANSVQVVKQCNAFSRVVDGVLLLARATHKTNCITEDVRMSYQIDERVQFILMHLNSLFPSKIKSLIYPFWAATNTPKSTDCVYGRHLLALLVVALTRNPQKIIYECHAPPKGYLKFVLWLLTRFQSFRCVVAISGALKVILLKQYKYLKSQDIVVAHDGCDPQVFTEAESSSFAVGYVGGIYQGRGLKLIVRLAVQLKDVDFHIVGGDVEQLKDVTSLEVPSNVICHGRVSQAQLGEYYKKFSVALAPYEHAVSTPGGTDTSAYMSPLKIFEYMGWGKVVLASDLPVLREVLNNGYNALTAPVDSLTDWESAIKKLRCDVCLMKDLSLQAYNDATTQYSWDRRSIQILEVL